MNVMGVFSINMEDSYCHKTEWLLTEAVDAPVL